MRKNVVSLVVIAVVVFLFQMNAYAGPRHDRDNNPPGPAGGPGTNWENPPGPAGGPGTSPDVAHRVVNPPPPAVVQSAPQPVPQIVPVTVPPQQEVAVADPWEKALDTNRDGVVDMKELQHWHKMQHKEMDSNP